MPKVITFGEIMLRLSTPGYLRFSQAREFAATFGGGEANVAVSLANFGIETEFVTRFPKNDIAASCIRDLHSYGVGTKYCIEGGDRLGIYFLETGAVARPSKVVYDRAHSAISEIEKGMIDWDKVFEGADWFHWTGITPAISQGAADVCLEAVRAANRLGVTVSCDLNYRNSRNKRLLAEITLIEVVQAALPEGSTENDDSNGLGPKQLTPIFSSSAPSGTISATTPSKATQVISKVSNNAATPPQPAPATTPTAPPSAARVPAEQAPAATAPRSLKRLQTISILDAQASEIQTAQAPSQSATDDNETLDERCPVESKNLSLPWLQYANRLPKEQTALAARMKHLTPILAGPEQIRVEVENQQVKQDFEEIRPDLLRFLRTFLHNSHLELEITLLDLKKAPRAYSKREQLEAIIKKYPDVERLRKELKLEFT